MFENPFVCAVRNSMKNYGRLGSGVHSFWQILCERCEWETILKAGVYCRRKGEAFRLGQGRIAWAAIGIAADTEEADYMWVCQNLSTVTSVAFHTVRVGGCISAGCISTLRASVPESTTLWYACLASCFVCLKIKDDQLMLHFSMLIFTRLNTDLCNAVCQVQIMSTVSGFSGSA